MQARLVDVQRQINTKRIEKESMQDKYQRVRGGEYRQLVIFNLHGMIQWHGMPSFFSRSQDCMTHGRMAAEAANQASGLQELQRFTSHCAAVLGLQEPSQGGGARQLIAAATAFQQQVGRLAGARNGWGCCSGPCDFPSASLRLRERGRQWSLSSARQRPCTGISCTRLMSTFHLLTAHRSSPQPPPPTHAGARMRASPRRWTASPRPCLSAARTCS